MGLARAVDESLKSNITREGTTVGTVDYMAPEQARDSQAADIRSDIYSLGCTWYQMLTGEPPYPTGSVTNKLYSHISKPRPDPRSLNRSVPEEIVAIMHRMMARKPTDRYQTPAELLEDLENLGAGNKRIAELLQLRNGRRFAGCGDAGLWNAADASPAPPPEPLGRIVPPRGKGREGADAASRKDARPTRQDARPREPRLRKDSQAGTRKTSSSQTRLRRGSRGRHAPGSPQRSRLAVGRPFAAQPIGLR